MAIAKKCDVCGKLYESYNIKYDSKKPNGVKFLSIDNNGKYFSYEALDLCPECMKSIMSYIESLKEEKKDETNT